MEAFGHEQLRRATLARQYNDMPLISSFYGVLIYLYWLDTRQHHLPHIHATYAGDEAVFAITSGELLDGALPRRQTRLV
jgi:hypothetical protein